MRNRTYALAATAGLLSMLVWTAPAAAGVVPSMNIVKLVNGQDADSPPGPQVAAGSTVTFTYVVTNTGPVSLGNVVVTDDKLGPISFTGGDVNGNGQLDLTETWIYVQTATALAGQQTNIGTVTAQDASATTATDSNTATYFGIAPSINIVKFVNGQDADSAPGPQVAPGSTVTFTYVVTNTGLVSLASVVITDDKLGTIPFAGGDVNANGQLDLSETWTYVQTATALAGQQTNIGTATGQVAGGTTATDNNSANYFGGTAGPSVPPSSSGLPDAYTAVPSGQDAAVWPLVVALAAIGIATLLVLPLRRRHRLDG